ncbi:MAG: hypothetical protein Q7U47_03575 [Paludibacter sp.]|nr:hypothetical protein [Paludibacter sp.]
MYNKKSGIHSGKIEMSAIIPQAGMDSGTGHAVNITAIRVADKLRLFGGGTTTFLKGTTIWNPIGGVTQSQNNFLKIIWIRY